MRSQRTNGTQTIKGGFAPVQSGPSRFRISLCEEKPENEYFYIIWIKPLLGRHRHRHATMGETLSSGQNYSSRFLLHPPNPNPPTPSALEPRFFRFGTRIGPADPLLNIFVFFNTQKRGARPHFHSWTIVIFLQTAI